MQEKFQEECNNVGSLKWKVFHCTADATSCAKTNDQSWHSAQLINPSRSKWESEANYGWKWNLMESESLEKSLMMVVIFFNQMPAVKIVLSQTKCNQMEIWRKVVLLRDIIRMEICIIWPWKWQDQFWESQFIDGRLLSLLKLQLAKSISFNLWTNPLFTVNSTTFSLYVEQTQNKAIIAQQFFSLFPHPWAGFLWQQKFWNFCSSSDSASALMTVHCIDVHTFAAFCISAVICFEMLCQYAVRYNSIQSTRCCGIQQS